MLKPSNHQGLLIQAAPFLRIPHTTRDEAPTDAKRRTQFRGSWEAAIPPTPSRLRLRLDLPAPLWRATRFLGDHDTHLPALHHLPGHHDAAAAPHAVDPPPPPHANMVPPLHHFVGSNAYEEPRPPRRGSHRPEQVPTRPLSVWSYSDDPSEDYFYHEQPTPRSFLLPSKRYAPYSRERPTLRGYEQPARISLADEHRYSSESPLTDSFVSSPESTDDSKTSSPLERLRHLKDHVPDRYSVEKSILESYVRAAPQSAACQSVQKRCMFPSCTKISVSRGLCRGHGGGRRCHVPGCTKSAQSRSNFCWAHGGGQRCEADDCMRSRKSKRFCVAHLHLENGEINAPGEKGDVAKTRNCGPTTRDTTAAITASPPSSAVPTMRALPSLGQALSSASRSAPNLPSRSYTKPLGLVYHTI